MRLKRVAMVQRIDRRPSCFTQPMWRSYASCTFAFPLNVSAGNRWLRTVREPGGSFCFYFSCVVLGCAVVGQRRWWGQSKRCCWPDLQGRIIACIIITLKKNNKVRTPFGRREPRSRHTFSWTVDPVRVDCEQRLIYMRVGLIRMTTPNSQQIVDRRISFRCLWPPLIFIDTFGYQREPRTHAQNSLGVNVRRTNVVTT